MGAGGGSIEVGIGAGIPDRGLPDSGRLDGRLDGGALAGER
jgi:hypothetical protein